MTISKEQVKAFHNIFGHTNNRPLQNTNNRAIMDYILIKVQPTGLMNILNYLKSTIAHKV
jgi:hypothetical protein